MKVNILSWRAKRFTISNPVLIFLIDWEFTCAFKLIFLDAKTTKVYSDLKYEHVGTILLPQVDGTYLEKKEKMPWTKPSNAIKKLSSSIPI